MGVIISITGVGTPHKKDTSLSEEIESWELITRVGTPHKNTNPPDEIDRWQIIYQERFARRMPPSYGLHAVLWDIIWRPYRTPTFKTRKPLLKTNFIWERCTPRYAAPTPEPISAELEAKTRQELARMFHEEVLGYGALRSHLYERWLPTLAAGSPYLSHGDALPPGLVLVDNRLRSSWLNKTTAVYFEPEFMHSFHGEYFDDGEGFFGNGLGYIARALLTAWLEVHHNEGKTPNIQQERYFAKPIVLKGQAGRLRATGDAVHTHRVICEELQNAQNEPIGPGDPYTWVEYGCEMGPIFRSVIVILDKQPALQRGKDGADKRVILFEQCSVLLVRTGDEDHLSAPVDLSTLTAAGLTLPLGRSEAAPVDSGADSRQQVVRVRMRTAVRFIMDLERRERDASARLTAMGKVLELETSREAERWAAAAFANAAHHGSLDRDRQTWEAVRRAQAHLDGDRCGLESEPLEESHHLRGWWT